MKNLTKSLIGMLSVALLLTVTGTAMAGDRDRDRYDGDRYSDRDRHDGGRDSSRDRDHGRYTSYRYEPARPVIIERAYCPPPRYVAPRTYYYDYRPVIVPAYNRVRYVTPVYRDTYGYGGCNSGGWGFSFFFRD